jgi:ribosomal protein S18 acetylase RimI-like enzyme
MTTRNRHAQPHGPCSTRGCHPAGVAPTNTHAGPRAAAQAKPAANSPRAPQPPRAPFGANAAHANAPRANAHAHARPQAPTPARVAPTAQRQTAAAPQKPSYRLLPATTLAGGRQQIRVGVAGSPRVAGSVDLRPTGGGKAYISNLKVERDFRRQGLAGQLMNAAIQSARQQGFKAARLEARPSDDGITPQALVSMYSRMGFRSVGRSSRGNPLMERRL